MSEAGIAGKAAAVTGAASGIGRATALTLAAAGARLLLGDIDEAGLAQTAERARALGAEVLTQPLDVRKSDQVVAFFALGGEAFGGIELFFNNAGIDGPTAKLLKSTEADFDAIFAVNVKGVYLCLREAVGQMVARGIAGAVVNTASIAGLVGSPLWPVYSASKHAVVGLTRSAAATYAAQGIRINAICPSVTDTPLLARITGNDERKRAALIATHPAGRAAQPEEIAKVVVFMLSPAASYMMGQAVAVDGGFTAV